MIVSSILRVQRALADLKIELNNWLINAFNGEWLKTANALPKKIDPAERKRDIVL